jgi:hypothetical protein
MTLLEITAEIIATIAALILLWYVTRIGETIRYTLSEKRRKKIRMLDQKELRKQNHLVEKYGKPAHKRLKEGIIQIGDDKDFVRHSWGVPLVINKNTTEHGITEVWKYEPQYNKKGKVLRNQYCKHLTFTDGQLTQIEEEVNE